MIIEANFRSGFVSIIGKPNVGKSTFLNKVLGEKISIISPKPQTTRHQIKGIYNDRSKQIVFLDTPGFLKPRYELHHKMMEYIKNSLNDSDLVIFITDVKTFPTDYDKELLTKINHLKVPKIALLNKIDLDKNKIYPKKIELLEEENFEKIIPLSVLHLSDVNLILDIISEYLPLSPPFYDKDNISDLPLRFFVQEIIREQIFLNFKDEIPYASTVLIEQYKDFTNKVQISANIWLEKKSQKPILLGKNGEKIKSIRIAAEKEIHKIIGKRIKLDVWIKIKQNWRKKKNALKELGYR